MSEFMELLDREWAQVASGPAARRRVRQWAHEQAALAGLGSPQAVLEERERCPLRAPAILTALARLAPSDELAARTLLQALLPGLVRMAGHLDKADLSVDGELVSLTWERIRTYPACRKGSVAANVLRDVRKRYWKHRQIEAPLKRQATDGCRVQPREPSAEEEALARIGFDELVTAARDLMGDHGAGLLIRTRVLDKTLEAVAAEDDRTVHAIRVRRHRAEQCLRLVRAPQARCNRGGATT